MKPIRYPKRRATDAAGHAKCLRMQLTGVLRDNQEVRDVAYR